MSVDDGRRPSRALAQARARRPPAPRPCRPSRAGSKPRSASAAATGAIAALSASRTERNAVPARRQRAPGGALGLRESRRQVGRARHDLAGRAHLRAEHGVGAGEARERQHRRLDAHLLGPPLLAAARARAGARPAARRHGRVDEVDAGRLARERHGARRARVDLDHVDTSRSRGRAGRSAARPRRAPARAA